MGHWARGEIWIPFDEWLEFVRKYMPETHGEWTIGPPREEDGALCVPFACNTECHPSDESDPPEWLKRKKV